MTEHISFTPFTELKASNVRYQFVFDKLAKEGVSELAFISDDEKPDIEKLVSILGDAIAVGKRDILVRILNSPMIFEPLTSSSGYSDLWMRTPGFIRDGLDMERQIVLETTANDASLANQPYNWLTTGKSPCRAWIENALVACTPVTDKADRRYQAYADILSAWVEMEPNKVKDALIQILDETIPSMAQQIPRDHIPLKESHVQILRKVAILHDYCRRSGVSHPVLSTLPDDFKVKVVKKSKTKLSKEERVLLKSRFAMLCEACKSGDLEGISLVVDKWFLHSPNLTASDTKGSTPIGYINYSKNPESRKIAAAQILFDAGYDFFSEGAFVKRSPRENPFHQLHRRSEDFGFGKYEKEWFDFLAAEAVKASVRTLGSVAARAMYDEFVLEISPDSSKTYPWQSAVLSAFEKLDFENVSQESAVTRTKARRKL